MTEEDFLQKDLMIIAAGMGTRMGSHSLPKALLPINGRPNLINTLDRIGGKFNNVYVVINELMKEEWDEALLKMMDEYPENFLNVQVISIKSGMGDGHAVLAALNVIYFEDQYSTASATNYIEFSDNDTTTIIWGDAYVQTGELVDEMFAALPDDYASAGIIPAVAEDNPYVAIIDTSDGDVMGAMFSKYGEKEPTGYHDQSIFTFKTRSLYSSLVCLHSALWKMNRYITSNGELSLLYCFHDLYNSGTPLKVYETKYPTLGYNTAKELEDINRLISCIS